MKISAYLEITMKVNDKNRPAAAKVYSNYRPPFLSIVPDALSKELLIRQEDVRVLHGFGSVEHTQTYLSSELFQSDVFVDLKPPWSVEPEVRTYFAA